MRRILTLGLALFLLAGACSSDDPSPRADGDPTGDDVVIELGGEEIVLTSSLSGFADCDTLLDHLRTEGAERVGPYGFNDGGWYGPWPVEGGFLDADMAVEEEAAAEPTDGGTSSGPAAAPRAADLVEGVDFSGTNIQERGVDEADLVKTDGERVYIVANSELVVVDVASRAVLGSVALLSSEQSELFLRGDDVLHVTYGWGGGIGEPVPFDGVAIEDVAAEDVAAEEVAVARDLIAPHHEGGPHTTVTRIAVSGTTPEILEAITIEGEYVSSRAVDGTARIVIRSNPQYDFPFVYPAGPSGEERAEESNRDALLDSELADWLPEYTTLDANGSATGNGLLTPCTGVHAPTEFAGFGVLSVFTVPVDGPIDPDATSAVLAPGAVVYASPDSVYVATTTWFDTIAWDERDWEEAQQNRTTSIHRFDITSASSAAYTASGSVAGDVRDSFSMSEHEGHLRVITTSGEPWSGNSETFVRVLRETEGELVEVGSVGDMGRGEAVQSVRFQGDVGYVVTFRTVDPLYTLDLSDPQNPVVRGELKIPGFSSYLHPIGDGLVLGVGSEADETDGRVTGSKVSLFDVSDLDNPVETATWVGPNGWNNVGWDTHAFLWWAPENLAVVPMELWDNGQHWAGAVVLRVDNGEITEVGRIDHIDENTDARGTTECDVVDTDDLPTQDESEFRSELEYMIFDDYSMVLDCGPGEDPSAKGFSCYPEPWLAEEAARIQLEVEGDLVICWDEGNQIPTILRSMVLDGDELWTISTEWGWLGGNSDARIQINDLASLVRLDVVEV